MWIVVSRRLGSALCYQVLTENGKIIAHTTLQHVTRYEAENPEIQQSIRNYHMTMQSYIGTYEFMSYLNGIDTLIKKGVP